MPITITPNPHNWTAFRVYGEFLSTSGKVHTYGVGRFTTLSEAVAFAERMPSVWTRPNGKKIEFVGVQICPMTFI